MGRQAVIVAVLAWTSACAVAQESRLFEDEPYDVLKLNDKEGTTFHIAPVDFPNRVVPKSPDPESVLRVRLVDRPDRRYDVAWKDVAELRRFEQLLLDEAAQLIERRRFAEAFEYFVFLRREYPHTIGLEDAETSLTVAEIEGALDERRPEAAMARLVRLQHRSPLHAELPMLTARTTEQLVALYLTAGQPRGARTVVERFSRQFPKHPQVDALQDRLKRVSDEQLAAARAALADRKFDEAQAFAQTAASLVREPSAALQVYHEAVAAYPVLTVGVVETAAPSTDRNGVPSWAERRLAPLARRPTLELTVTPGPPSRADYAGGANRFAADQRDPLHGELKLAPGPGRLTAATAAALLSAAAAPDRPTSRADLFERIAELRVGDPQTLEIHWARRHPRFEALVAEVLNGPPVDGEARLAPYPIDSSTDALAVRRRSEAAEDGGPAKIVERQFADEDDAVAALLAGDVDVVDRVAPWQVERLGELRDVSLVRYAAPSVHLLLFNTASDRLRSAELRRAVGYALDRESILRNHLQPSRADAASRLTDGVFPIGRAVDDPLGYAYDGLGDSRTYDPQRAFLLTTLATGPAPDERPLVLAHPATATAAKAARRIAAYLERQGLVVELRPAPTSAAPMSADAADLTYVVTSSTEPLVEVVRWFGSGGLVNLDSRALREAVAQAARAESPAAARAALFDIQRVLHDEALLVPLWQLTEYAAHRGRIVPPVDLVPTSLYQHVDRLRVLPQYSETLP